VSDALADALAYAAQGLHVHPFYNLRKDGSCTCGKADCEDPGKHPWSAHGKDDASADPATIRELWKGKPTAQVGMNCGASGVVVLDTDVHGETDGRPAWAALEAEHPALASAPMAETPSEGWHVLLRMNGNRIGCPGPTKEHPEGPLGAGIDVKGIGGSVILPSAASPGRDWVPGRELAAVPLPELPRDVAARLTYTTTRPERRRAAREAEKLAKVAEGGRHAYLLSRAGTMRAAGFTENVIAAALQVENLEMCAPPRTAEHVAEIAAYVAEKPTKPNVDAPKSRRYVRAYSLPELAALQPEQVDWVLDDYIAAGDVFSLESPPKGGKTTLERKLHVHVATGAPFLGRAVKQGPSLYCTEERFGTSREGFARAGGFTCRTST